MSNPFARLLSLFRPEPEPAPEPTPEPEPARPRFEIIRYTGGVDLIDNVAGMIYPFVYPTSAERARSMIEAGVAPDFLGYPIR